MPVRDNREYRSCNNENDELRFQATDEEERYVVTGYATVWDKPYVLHTDENGNKYYEVVRRSAFTNTDLSDVVFQLEHTGTVYARTKNDSLKLTVDDYGLKIDADLSGIEAGKEVYRSIKNGLLQNMSWGFKVSADTYDTRTRTRTITGVNKVYDVSAVSFPACPDTTISARSLIDGYVELERLDEAKRAEQETLRQKIRILAEH